MRKISLILAQSKRHKERFTDIGVLSENIKVVGSTKFDGNENIFLSDHLSLQDKKFILAASTHYGEEEKILDAFHNVKNEIPDLKLISVPRHPERTDEILKISREMGISSKAAKEIPGAFDLNDVIVINATGILKKLYSIANVSFIGGSLLSKYGGHNVIEAAARGKATIVGPHTDNFMDEVEYLRSRGALEIAENEQELASKWAEISTGESARHRLEAATIAAYRNLPDKVEEYIELVAAAIDLHHAKTVQ